MKKKLDHDSGGAAGPSTDFPGDSRPRAALRAVRQRWRRLDRRARWVLGGAVIGAAGIALGGLVIAVLNRDSTPPAGDSPPNAGGIVYLAPASAYAPDLYRADPATGSAAPVISAPDSIDGYAVSPAGRQVAYALYNPDGTADIWLLDLDTTTARPLTRCVQARCTMPAWKPDGSALAYRRADFNPATGRAEDRAWIVDVQTVQTRLLFDDPQIHGTAPTWDPTGRRVAVFDDTVPGIRIHDTRTGTDTVIANAQGAVGTFSPDGTRLVYPVLVRGVIGQQFYTHLVMIDLDSGVITRISGAEDAPVEDGSAVWFADGTRLLVTRRYLDHRCTAGAQLYVLDLATGAAAPLVVDPAYHHAGPVLDASGRRIVFQRLPLPESGAGPSIWVYDLESGDLKRVAENAFLPAWVA